LDYAKAFDSVPHQRLLSKLRTYGITGNAVEWIKDFLANRSQKVVIKGKLSKPEWVKNGIPQGSVLGPLLFMPYVNDMPETTRSPGF
jgi:hypothetical protein